MQRTVFFFIFIHVFIFLLASSALFGAKMYWTDSTGIQRAELNGTDIETVLFGRSPGGIAVDTIGAKIYWSDSRGDRMLHRANLDGTNIERLFTATTYNIDIDANAGKIYWLDNAAKTIQRANFDVTGIEVLVSIEKTVIVGSIAIDASSGKIYWTDSRTGKIHRANLDGGAIEDVITGLSAPVEVEVHEAAGKIYWAGANPDGIYSANTDGTGFQLLVSTGADFPTNIIVDAVGAKIYWTMHIVTGNVCKIQRANLDGTSVEDLITSDLFIRLNRIAVDGKNGKVVVVNMRVDTIARGDISPTPSVSPPW